MDLELSCDLGEAANDDERTVEEAIWPMIDAANVACGGHAGDEASMRFAVEQCRLLAVILGAHPSYPDRENFGRRSMQMDPRALRDSIADQLDALKRAGDAAGVPLDRVKPHGALYNDAHRDLALASVILDAMQDVDASLAIVTSETSAMAEVARDRSVPIIREAFGDRRYMPDGSLVPRSRPDSLLIEVEEAAKQAKKLAETGRVTAADGGEIAINFETLCIHADMPNAVGRLRAIRAALQRV